MSKVQGDSITIYRVSCQMCGEIFCATTLKKAKAKHKNHVEKDCKLLRFWKKANEILGRELTTKEVYDLLGIKHKLEEQENGKDISRRSRRTC